MEEEQKPSYLVKTETASPTRSPTPSTRPAYLGPPLRRLPELPPINPARRITLDDYSLLLEQHPTQFVPVGRDIHVKGVILEEIEKFPELWDMSVPRLTEDMMRNDFSHVAVQVYSRTGLLISWRDISRNFRRAKDALRLKIRRLYLKKNLTPMIMEESLWNWEIYGFLRYLRPSLEDYEAVLREEKQRLEAAAEALAEQIHESYSKTDKETFDDMLDEVVEQSTEEHEQDDSEAPDMTHQYFNYFGGPHEPTGRYSDVPKRRIVERFHQAPYSELNRSPRLQQETPSTSSTTASTSALHNAPHRRLVTAAPLPSIDYRRQVAGKGLATSSASTSTSAVQKGPPMRRIVERFHHAPYSELNRSRCHQREAPPTTSSIPASTPALRNAPHRRLIEKLHPIQYTGGGPSTSTTPQSTAPRYTLEPPRKYRINESEQELRNFFARNAKAASGSGSNSGSRVGPSQSPTVDSSRSTDWQGSCSSADSPSTPTSSADSTSREDFDELSSLVLRIVRDDPDQMRLIRKAMFDVILRMDFKTYTSAKELFNDLADGD